MGLLHFFLSHTPFIVTEGRSPFLSHLSMQHIIRTWFLHVHHMLQVIGGCISPPTINLWIPMHFECMASAASPENRQLNMCDCLNCCQTLWLELSFSERKSMASCTSFKRFAVLFCGWPCNSSHKDNRQMQHPTSVLNSGQCSCVHWKFPLHQLTLTSKRKAEWRAFGLCLYTDMIV